MRDWEEYLNPSRDFDREREDLWDECDWKYDHMREQEAVSNG